MSSYYLFFKSFHIIGFVAWFAGLFYLVRMFVYHSEANEKPEAIREDWKKQFTLMQWRVFKIIATPAMVITWICGLSMLAINPAIFQQSWIYAKLILLVLMVVYHFYCKKIIQNQERGIGTYNSFQFRLLNELPTLFLVAIVILAVLKDFVNFLMLFGGILIFGFLLYLSAKAYKNRRESQKSNP